MDKYYVPDIEDIRVGYKYERLDCEKWINKIIEEWELYTPNIGEACDSEISEILRDLNSGKIRTPYLTKEQIELELNNQQLNWRYGRNDGCYTHYILTEWIKIWFSDNDVTNVWVTYINANNDYRNDVPFTIKSINEFRTLLKFLNI